jgi:hypothetical protein
MSAAVQNLGYSLRKTGQLPARMDLGAFSCDHVEIRVAAALVRLAKASEKMTCLASPR